MTKTELNSFRSTLEITQTELGSGTTSREALAIEASPEELDRIQQAGDREYAMRNLERNSSRLREVRAALRRIDAGTFGICAGCDESINPKRLAALPWASFCIACQEAADLEQKIPQGELDISPVMAA
jgi:RNA polymerase-binding transcription factor